MADFSALIKAKIDTTDIKKQLKQVGTTEKITIKADTKEVTAGLRAVTTQTEKYKNALGQATTVTRSYNTAGEQVSGTMKTVTASTATATKATKSLGQEFISTIGKVAKFGAATAVIGLFTTAVYQAWEAIKGFDDAVTDFKKVSDLSGNSLTEYTKKLGDLGASLGRTRTQMLEASTEFVKAGYTEEQSAILAQTATLFQNVADSEVSAADSASYVISQMKAFNIEATDAISIIDKTNEVANRFAVSSTDISLALTKSSSALATYGNDINQSIGLVTAGTEIMTNQASKVSKGLRSIGAQLVKMATSTGELSYKIQGATKTLSLFDEQTGEMKSTYDILLEISQSWDKMEASEKSALAVQVAGKTQIDVFTSVLGNFNTAINANATALNSAGSAAKENAAYMESLEAKINGLKAQFENLVLGDGGVASFIKLIIDGGTSLLKFANTDLGKVIIAGGLAITMFNALRTSVMGLNLVWGAFNIATWATQFAQGLAVVTAGTNIFTGSVAALTAIWNSSPFVAISLVIAGVYALVKVFDALTTSFKEQQEIVANLKTEIQSLQSEYDALASKSTRTADEEAYLKILEAEIALKKQDLIIESKRAYQKYQKTQTPTSGMQVISGDFGGGELAASKIEDYNKQLLELDINSKNYAETKEKLISKRAEEITKMVAERDLLQDILNVGGELTPEEQARLDRYNSLIVASSSLGGATGDLSDETDGLADSLEKEKTALQVLIESLNSVKDATDSVKDAFKDFNEDGSLTYSTIADIADKFADVEGIDEYVNRLADASLTGDELNQIMGELTMALIEQKIATGELDATQTSLITKMLEEAGIANAAQIANQLLANSQNNLKFSGENAAVGLTKEQKAAIQAKIALFQTQRAAKSLSGTTLDPSGILAGLNKIITKSLQATSALANVTGGASIVAALKGASASGVTQFGKTSIIPQIQWTTDVASGGGSGGGGATTDPIEEQSKAFKEQNKILEHQLFLLEQREGTELEQVELQKKIQEQLYQQAEWYRAQGVDENSDYLRDLSESWWKYEKSIQDIYDDIAKAAQESAKKQLETQKEALETQKEALEIQKDNFETAIDYYVGLIDKEIDALEAEKEAIQDRYDAQIDALKETNSELDNQIEREKLLSNLAKAKSTQKLVYKDGKYQYVSNVQAISEAQQALNEFDRQRKLEREVKALERARDAEVKAIDDQIKAWQDYAKEWKNIVNDYQNSQNKLIAEQVLGISLEKLNWDTRLQNAQDFVTKYNSIMSQIKAVEQQEQALVAGTDSDTYTDSTDWSQTWKDADARYKSGEYSKEQADAIKDYAHEQKTSEMQGSGKTYNPASGEWYANGTTSATGGLSMVGEKGSELRVLNKGDGIIPHNITENLMALGKYSPTNLMNKLSSVGSGSNVYQYSFDKLILPNVSDANSFVKALQNFKPMAIQAGSSR